MYCGMVARNRLTSENLVDFLFANFVLVFSWLALQNDLISVYESYGLTELQVHSLLRRLLCVAADWECRIFARILLCTQPFVHEACWLCVARCAHPVVRIPLCVFHCVYPV